MNKNNSNDLLKYSNYFHGKEAMNMLLNIAYNENEEFKKILKYIKDKEKLRLNYIQKLKKLDTNMISSNTNTSFKSYKLILQTFESNNKLELVQKKFK